MDMHKHNIDATLEACAELDFEIPQNVAENIVCWIEGNYENSSLLSGIEAPRPSSECECLQAEIDRLRLEVAAYQQSVKERRNCDDVWIEDGRVVYR